MNDFVVGVGQRNIVVHLQTESDFFDSHSLADLQFGGHGDDCLMYHVARFGTCFEEMATCALYCEK